MRNVTDWRRNTLNLNQLRFVTITTGLLPHLKNGKDLPTIVGFLPNSELSTLSSVIGNKSRSTNTTLGKRITVKWLSCMTAKMLAQSHQAMLDTIEVNFTACMFEADWTEADLPPDPPDGPPPPPDACLGTALSKIFNSTLDEDLSQ